MKKRTPRPEKKRSEKGIPRGQWVHNDGSRNMPKISDSDKEKNPNYRP